MIVALILSFIPAVAERQRERPDNKYKEWPMVHLDCGTFPAVRIIVARQETEARGFIRNGRSFLPAREALERLGGKVTWVQSQKAFYARFPRRDRTVRVTVRSRNMRIYRYDMDKKYSAGRLVRTVRLDAAPFVCEGRVFAPVRTAVDAVSGKITYDRKSRTVYITPPRS